MTTTLDSLATSERSDQLGSPPGGAGSAPGRRPWQFEPDLVRFIGLLMVVVIHCAPWPQTAGLYATLGLLSRPSVPLFVILSGLLLAPGLPERARTRPFWYRRLSRTLAPWLLWALVYFGLDVAFEAMPPGWSQSWGWWAGGAGHLYFLLLIPQLYLLLLVWPRTRRAQLMLTLAALALQTTLQLMRTLLPIHGGLWHLVVLDFGFEEAPFWVGYFALGLLLGCALPRLLRARGPLVAYAAALVGAAALLLADPLNAAAVHGGPWLQGTGAFLRPTLPLLTVAVFLASFRVAAWLLPLRRVVESVSRHALGIYIIHPAILMATGPLLQVAPGPLSLEQRLPGSLLPFGVLLLACLGGGWAATRLIATWRPASWAVGE